MLSKLLRLIGANVGRLTCKKGRWWLVHWRFYLLPNGQISILNACHVSQNNLHARVVKPWSRMIAYCMLNVNDKCTKHMIPWTKKMCTMVKSYWYLLGILWMKYPFVTAEVEFSYFLIWFGFWQQWFRDQALECITLDDRVMTMEIAVAVNHFALKNNMAIHSAGVM